MVYQYSKDENGLFVCQHCGERQKNQNTMHYHYKKAHDNAMPFSCRHCEYKCLHQNTLNLHIAAKHPETDIAKTVPILKCPCNGCSFQTLTRGNRLIHFIRKHCKSEAALLLQEKDGELECRTCKKTFSSSTSFHYHAAHCIQLKDAAKLRQLQTLMTPA